MKKLFKRKDSAEAPQVEVDVAGLMDSIQQQLASLERKVDTLISQSQGGRPNFQRFDHHQRHHDRDRRDNGFRERNYTKVICADCGNECEVTFKPSADRPVYCKECFSKRKEGGFGSFKREHDSRPREGDFHKGHHFDKHEGAEGRRFGKKDRKSVV